MPLNISKGNMYDFVTHTWNTVKGACPHDCSYCYMKRWGEQKPARFDESELKTDLGTNGFIFVGSSCDLFASDNDYKWIYDTLEHCNEYPDNRYLFQTKNPEEIRLWESYIPDNSTVCVTLESNRHYPLIMKDAPTPFNRALHLKNFIFRKMVTIEPILDFGLGAFVEMIRSIGPVQVNIGADSGNNHLPEPSWEKVVQLINRLNEFTTVIEKPNLGRLKREIGE